MTTTLRENADTAAVVKYIVNSIVDLCLVELGRNLKVCPLEIFCSARLLLSSIDKCTILGHVISACKLLHGNTTLEASLQLDLFFADDLEYFCCSRLVVHLWQHNRAADLEFLVLEIGVDTS